MVYHRLSWCKSVYGTESHAPVNTPKRREENINLRSGNVVIAAKPKHQTSRSVDDRLELSL